MAVIINLRRNCKDVMVSHLKKQHLCMNISDHKVFVFDLGMVLVSLYRKECVENFRLLGIEDAAAMIGNCSQDGPFGALEYGLISVEKFCDELAQISSRKITEKDILNVKISFLSFKTKIVRL